MGKGWGSGCVGKGVGAEKQTVGLVKFRHGSLPATQYTERKIDHKKNQMR